LAAGLSDLLAGRPTSIGESSTASSSSSSFKSTSLDRGVGIDGVTTADGEVAFLFLFFFFSAALIAETAAEAAETDYFTAVDLVLRWDFQAPPESGPVPTLPLTSTSVSSSASTDESYS
jgi:hypothetical protein